MLVDNTNGLIYATPAREGGEAAFKVQHCPGRDRLIGVWHTHGRKTTGYDSEIFSGTPGGWGGDIFVAEFNRMPNFLGTPSGKIKVYIPDSAIVQGPGLLKIEGGRIMTLKERAP